MATYTLSVPATGLFAPSIIGDRKTVQKTVLDGLNNYGSYFKFASENSKLPVEVLLAFAAVESGIGKNIGAAGHITRGIMQWNRDLVWASLEYEKKSGRMTPAEESKLKSFGITFNSAGKMLVNGAATTKIPESIQIKPELNILVGSILLGQYVDSLHDGGKKTVVDGKQRIWAQDANGTLRIDKIVGVYNAGPYGATGKAARQNNYPTVKSFRDSINATSASYIDRIYGKGGYFDILYTDLANNPTLKSYQGA
jgi:hypothetical protein